MTVTMTAHTTGRHLTRNGSPVEVRTTTASDAPQVLSLMQGLSPASLYLRFFSSAPRCEEYAASLLDPARTLTSVVAVMGSRFLAVGSIHPLPDLAGEFAVAVADADQGHGVGTLVVEELIRRGRAAGLHTMVGEVLGMNSQMLEVLRHLGVDDRLQPQDGVVDLCVRLDAVDAFEEACRRRAAVAEREFLRPLFHPASVLVVHEGRGTGPAGSVHGSAPVAHLDLAAPESRRRRVPSAELVVVDRVGDDRSVVDVAVQAQAQVVLLTDSGGAAGPSRGRSVARACTEHGVRLVGPGADVLVGPPQPDWIRVGVVGRRRTPTPVAVVCASGIGAAVVRQLQALGVDPMLAVDVGAGAGVDLAEVVEWVRANTSAGMVLVAGAPDLLECLARQPGHAEPGAALVVTFPGATDRVVRDLAAEVVDSRRALVTLAQVGARVRHPSLRLALLTNHPWPAHAGVNSALRRAGLDQPDLTQFADGRLKAISRGARIRGSVVTVDLDVTAASLADSLELLVEEPGVDVVVVDVTPSRHLAARRVRRVVARVTGEHSSALCIVVDPAVRRPSADLVVVGSVAEAVRALATASAGAAYRAGRGGPVARVTAGGVGTFGPDWACRARVDWQDGQGNAREDKADDVQRTRHVRKRRAGRRAL